MGPFLSDLGPAERKARLRCSRLAVKIFTGPRGEACRYALLLAEISGEDPEMLAEAEAAFGRLGAVDRRRVLSSFVTSNEYQLMVLISLLVGR